MLEIPAEYQSMDNELSAVFAQFAPPEDLGRRIIANLQRRARLTINPRVIQSAAAVAAVLVIGTFGYLADKQLNPPKTDSNQVASNLGWYFKSGAGNASFKQTAANTESELLGESKGIADQAELNGRPLSSSQLGGRTQLGDSDVDGIADALPHQIISGKKLADDSGKRSNGQRATNAPRDGNDTILLPTDEKSDFAKDRFGLNGSNTYTAGTIINGGTLGISAAKIDSFKPAAANEVQMKLGTELSVVQKNKSLNELSKASTDSSNVRFADGHASWAITTSGESKTESNSPSDKPSQIALADSEGKPVAPQPVQQQMQQQLQQMPPQPVQAEPARRVIRTGNMEFEVDSFDSSLMTITKLATEDGGFIASTDSAKLPNGKTRGAVTVRMPPERLDTFVLKLRGIGDLKTQKISSQDVSKSYTDIESGLRAARAMESRLIEMIQKGSGAIKDLLAAEKELGVWREKIEQMEGEKRFYDNQISLSTLTITVQERDIKAAAGAIENERISTGVETDDVEKSRAEILKTLDAVGGRILTSDLKKLDAGQFAANITAEVASEKSGEVIDRLKQIGKIARMDIDRKQTTVDGQGTPAPGAHIEKKPTVIAISIYNLANVAPRLTTSLTIASSDVETSYKQILLDIEKAGGRAVSSQLQRPKSDQIVANLQIECPSAKAAELQNALKSQGETMNLQLTENPDTANVTTAKTGYSVQIISAAAVAPRETSSLQLAASDVAAAHKALNDAASKIGARVMQSSLSDSEQNNLVSSINLEIPRSMIDEFDKTLVKSGDVLKRSVARSSDTQNTIDSKVRLDLTIYAANRLPPRESTTAVVNVGSADNSQASYAAMAQELGGRVIDQGVSRDPNGRNSAKITIDVPRDKAPNVIASLRSNGDLWSLNTSSNPQAPDGLLARSRFDLTFAEGEALVTRDSGIWQSLKDGLSTSLRGLAWSVQILIVGLCLVAPWVLILWGGWKLLRKRKPKAA